MGIEDKETYKHMEDTYKDIFALFEHVNVPMPNGQILHRPPQFEVIEMGDGELCAVPMPMFPLFRGQCRYFDVCKPTLYRSNLTQEASFEREMQLADFKYILNEHPEIKDRIKVGIKINYEGLAQHYGIPTDILDFTNSPLVAAFFATTTYDAETNTYKPIIHTISRGVIYVTQFGGVIESMIPDMSCTMPIGMEALHRPGEQRAYGRKMKPEEDLNTSFGYNKFFFWHTPDASVKVWQLCKGMSCFFPYDPMVEKVRAIMKYHIYSETALRYAYTVLPNFAKDIDGARVKMEKAGCHFVDYVPFAYTQSELDHIREELHQMYPGSY